MDSRSFRWVVGLVAAVSFGVLLSRGRPVGNMRGVQPLLFASGLTQPRGLAFLPDGTLLVTEAGSAGPAALSTAGRILVLDQRGQPTVLLDGLPPATSITPLFAEAGPGVLLRAPGAGAVPTYVFIGPTPDISFGALARLAGGSGPEQGQLEFLTTLATGAGQNPKGPAAVTGAALAPDGAIYTALPLANLLLRIQPGNNSAGRLTTVQPITGFIGPGQQNPYPTSVAVEPDGTVLVALFGTEPFHSGGGRVVRVQQDGRWQPAFEGLTLPVSVGYAPDGQLYVLEFASGYDSRAGRFTPGSGRLLAVGPAPGKRRVIVRDIEYPTALAFSPSGDAYFTERGALSPAGAGRVLRVVAELLRG